MKTVKKRSQKQEKSVAKDFDAKVVVASGALWGAKGDVRSDKCLIECKTTEKSYYSVTSKVWEKIEREALKDGMRIPLLIVDLEDKDRVVVFNPKYFETPLQFQYDCTYNGDGNKSYRVSLKELLEAEEYFGDYIYGKLFIVCGEKKNMLFFMRFKDFIEAFKEEL